MPSSQDYASRLREDARRALEPELNGLADEISQIQRDISSSLENLGNKLDALRNFALADADSVVQEALQEAEREKESALRELAEERDSALEAAVRAKEEELRVALVKQEETHRTAVQEKEQALSTVIREKEEALQTILREKEEALEAADREKDAVLQESARGKDEIREKVTREKEQALEDAARARDVELADLALYARELRQLETQEEILNLMLDEAFRFTSKTALFIAREDRIAGWSSRGFSTPVAETLSSCTFEQSPDSVFRKTAEGEDIVSVEGFEQDAPLKFIEQDNPGPWYVFPLKALGRPLAFLLAAATDSSNSDSLRILMDLTGLRVENFALKILQEMSPQAQQASIRLSEVETAAEKEEVQAGTPDLGAGQEEQAGAVAQFAAASTVGEQGGEPAREGWRDEVSEIPSPVPSAEHITEEPPAKEQEAEWAQELRSETATTVEASPVPSPEPPLARESTPQTVEAQPTAGLSEEEKLHADAKRFARLLVSEIKLYNEQRVSEGRKNRDIYVRLKKDIDRSREMYENRVAPSVTRKIDYFHDEVVRILGDNDPATLGSDYPGPRVES